MIDPNLPLELDDGRPVLLITVAKGAVEVEFDGPHIRRDSAARSEINRWWYETSDGSWSGDFNNTMFRLQNVVPKGPDRIAEMFT